MPRSCQYGSKLAWDKQIKRQIDELIQKKSQLKNK